MIVSVKSGFDPNAVRDALAGLGLWVVRHDGHRGGVCFHVAAHSQAINAGRILEIDGVSELSQASSAHPLVDAQSGAVAIGDLDLGPDRAPVLMAGPCAVESEEQIRRIAARLQALGVRVIRGGGFKPRSSPYAFQGLGETALTWLRAAADAHGLLVITEALGEATVSTVADHADIIQIGSRNMHNYALLTRAASVAKPILLKRGMSATVEEWLLAGEYCLAGGAASVIFCERGVRGFDTSTRNLLDLGSVALLAHVHRQPVIVDPSHALGRRDLIVPMSLAALAAGSAGLLVETHEHPDVARSDGPQALLPDQLGELARAVAAHDSADRRGRQETPSPRGMRRELR